MRYEFPQYSSVEETVKINELLGADESYFTILTILNNLPQEIEYNGRKGYLAISPMEISYTALDPVPELKVCTMFPFGPMAKCSIFEAFIHALEFFQEHEGEVKILD